MDIADLYGGMSIAETQAFLDGFPYDWDTAAVDEAGNMPNYRVSSPRITLERGCAMCIDGALVGAALTGFKPTIMSFKYPDCGLLHSVLMYEADGLFGAIGKSRHADQTHRKARYRSEEALAGSYGAAFYDVIAWDALFPDWLYTDADLSVHRLHWQEIRPDLRQRLLDLISVPVHPDALMLLPQDL